RPAADTANGAQLGDHGFVIHVAPTFGLHLAFGKVRRKIRYIFSLTFWQARKRRILRGERKDGFRGRLAVATCQKPLPRGGGSLLGTLMADERARQRQERRIGRRQPDVRVLWNDTAKDPV